MKSLRYISIFFCLLIAPSLPASSFAEETVITADTLEQTGSEYTAQGSVRIKRGNIVIGADEVTYNLDTEDASLRGNVFYEDYETTMRAKEGHLNLKTEEGLLYDANVFIKKDNYHIKGAEIRKGKGKRYYLKNASLTTCDASLPAWCIRGRKVDVLIGDRIVAKGASLRIKGMPVFYTPYVWAPILTDRKTGLLMPEVGYSRTKGFYFKQPFFWAVRENRDFTFYIDGHTKRGLGQGVEYRYIEKNRLEGTTYLYHIRDTELRRDFYELRAAHHKWARNPKLTGLGGSTGYINLNIVSHREFPRIYQPYLEERSRRFLESAFEMQALLNEQSRVYLRGNYLIELKEGVSQSLVSSRLPEVGFVHSPIDAGPARLSFNAAISNFSREAGHEGQRLTLNARIAHTAGQTLTLSQALDARAAFYELRGNGQDNDYNHETLNYNLILQDRFIKGYQAVSHVIVPSISYRYIYQNQDVPLVFDSVELRPPETTLELALMNRFMDKKGEFFSLRAGGVLDSRDGNNLKLGMMLKRPFNLRTNATYDLKEGEFEDANSELGMKVLKIDISLGQNYTRQADVLLHTFGLGYTYSKALSLKGKLWYDSKEGQMSNLMGEINYQRQCWGMNVSLIKKPDDLSVFLTITMKGLGSFKTL